MLNISIEGNIGASKSTILNYIKEKYPNNFNIYFEPVDKWCNVNSVNLLDLLYSDPKRWGFIFQSYVQLTMLELHSFMQKNEFEIDENSQKENKNSNNEIINFNKKNKKSLKDKKDKISLFKDTKINLMERSIFSARFIFVENLYLSKMLTDIEYNILNESFEYLIKREKVKLDLIIYLKASPETCFNRVLQRSRPEEIHAIKLDNIQKLHLLYEQFLGENSNFQKVMNIPVLTLETEDTKENIFCKIDKMLLFIMKSFTK